MTYLAVMIASSLIALTFVGWGMECKKVHRSKAFCLRGCILSTGSVAIMGLLLILVSSWVPVLDAKQMTRDDLMMESLQYTRQDLQELLARSDKDAKLHGDGD